MNSTSQISTMHGPGTRGTTRCLRADPSASRGNGSRSRTTYVCQVYILGMLECARMSLVSCFLGASDRASFLSGRNNQIPKSVGILTTVPLLPSSRLTTSLLVGEDRGTADNEATDPPAMDIHISRVYIYNRSPPVTIAITICKQIDPYPVWCIIPPD